MNYNRGGIRNIYLLVAIVNVLFFCHENANADNFKKWECEGIAQGAASYYNILYYEGLEALNNKVKLDEKKYPEARQMQQAAKEFAILFNMAIKEEQPGVKANTNEVIELARAACHKIEF